jgi:UDP-glucuronate 4-epimerase
MKIVVTGAAGFIGHHLTIALLELGHEVVGIDNLKPAYGDELIPIRLNKIYNCNNSHKFDLVNLDLSKQSSLEVLDKFSDVNAIVHLAAYPGVRKGEDNPTLYFQNNILSTSVILEFARIKNIEIMLYASSSSVYGDLGVGGPISELLAKHEDIKSVYGLTKWTNELQARQFSRNFGSKNIGLRFFTVFGSEGRPDMGYAIFAKAISKGSKVPIFGDLNSTRDYTYIDDLVEQIKMVLYALEIPSHKLSIDLAREGSLILNLGLGNPKTLDEIISAIENTLERKAELEFIPRLNNDSQATYADNSLMQSYFDLKDETDFQVAIRATLKSDSINWYQT